MIANNQITKTKCRRSFKVGALVDLEGWNNVGDVGLRVGRKVVLGLLEVGALVDLEDWNVGESCTNTLLKGPTIRFSGINEDKLLYIDNFTIYLDVCVTVVASV